VACCTGNATGTDERHDLDEYRNLLENGYGWRARIGFLSPGLVDETVSRQFYLMAPAGVTMVRTSLGVGALTTDEISDAVGRAEAAARTLATAHPDCIILGGSPTVVIGGLGYDTELRDVIEKASGIPSSTAQTAAVEAFRLLGITRLAVVTPFPEPFPTMLNEFLTRSGFSVLAMDSLPVDYRDLTMSPLRDGYELARRTFAAAGNADAVYFPGAPFPVADLIEPLEQELQTTVISSMQATLWKGLRMAGATDAVIRGYGRLLGTALNA
jgi:maleate cis-trans isomerase